MARLRQENTSLRERLIALLELVDMQDAEIAVLKTERGNGEDETRITYWTALEHQQRLYGDAVHTQILVENIDGKRARHYHVTKGNPGAGMIGVTAIMPLDV